MSVTRGKTYDEDFNCEVLSEIRARYGGSTLVGTYEQVGRIDLYVEHDSATNVVLQVTTS